MKFSTLSLVVLLLTGCSLTPEQAKYIADGLNETTRRMNEATFRNSQMYQAPVGNQGSGWQQTQLQSSYNNNSYSAMKTCRYKSIEGAVATVQIQGSCRNFIEYNLNTNAWKTGY